ncbi:putative odorant receptor 83c [Topomyia yanbarensis]|uniref:putative odorant receptor 83c n=1 Tax=Topomyia yanbarensis TaxID=2498891 RepID=UPI00273C2626|nr:putative odorant receptor 83c [Topomyia yanbarensis]
MDFINGLQRFKLFQNFIRNPSEFSAQLLVIPNRVASIVGLDVYSPDYTVPNRNLMYSLISVCIFYYIDTTSAYEMRHEPENLINCLVTFGIGIQIIGKVFTFVYFRKDLIGMHEYTLVLLKEECNPRTKPMLMGKLFLLSVILKTMLICYAFTSVVLDVVPLLFLWQTGEKILPFGFYIPYIDPNSWSGYLLNYALQILLTVFVSSGDMGPDCIYVIILMNAFIQIDLLVSSLQEVNRQIELGDEEMANCFQKIIKRHQEHLKYLRTVENVFRFNFFVTFASLASVLVTALFAVVKLSWYQGYVFIAFVSYQLFFGCFLGTLLEMKNEQLQREIYNLCWYKLSNSNRKSHRFLLQGSQQPVCLTIIFGKLNMPTYLQVYKMIYSIFTMLLTAREE